MTAERAVVRAGVLDVMVERSGDRHGRLVVLLHGFPYDVRAYDDVASELAMQGADVVVPYLRGYGGTRFVDEATPRFAAAAHPQSPDAERRLWYQYYFHGGLGAAGLAKYRDDLARALSREWSPSWAFTENELRASTASFASPDFADVVIHSYRHRFGLVAGDPAYEHTEQQLAAQPQITVPTVVLDGDTDGVTPPRELSEHEPHFTALVDYRRLPGIGHNVPQEASAEFARAVTTLR